ncbi:FecR family protein [Sphingomonas elodea]|uniref:FecR family protein n=1 Tax=Sphingomonas elodea TaxID=179878 RepID=UPI0002630455|nr:FecR domain-containing protein [Sphingomonas elodea]
MSDRVEDEAARWALRHPLDAAGQQALEGWLAADRRHAGALLRAQAALSVIDESLAPEAPARPMVRPSRRWLLGAAGGGLAASFAAIIGLPRLWGERLATAKGEIRRLPLSDGSIAALDTDSSVRVLLSKDSRQIALDRGQAWFQVAKDRRRPFVVDAGIAHARAVGTAFSVHRTETGVQIAVTEGVVAVWATDASGAMSILHAGDYARFEAGNPNPQIGSAPAAIERALAWREGEVSLEGDTLRSAIDTFNRYNHQQLVLTDEALGREKLVGLFKINSPLDFAQTLEATLDVQVTASADEILLSRKK